MRAKGTRIKIKADALYDQLHGKKWQTFRLHETLYRSAQVNGSWLEFKYLGWKCRVHADSWAVTFRDDPDDTRHDPEFQSLPDTGDRDAS